MRRILALTVLAGILMIGAFGSSAFAQDTPDPEVGGTIVTVGPEVGGTSASLPFTGSTSTGTWVLAASALVAVGGLLVIAGRRRADVLTRS